MSKKKSLGFTFSGRLYDTPERPQKQAFEAAYTVLKRDDRLRNGCTIIMQPGSGKTVLALALLAKLSPKKTLIIVNKKFLLEQWIARIREFLSIDTEGGGGETEAAAGKNETNNAAAPPKLMLVEAFKPPPRSSSSTSSFSSSSSKKNQKNKTIGAAMITVAMVQTLNSYFQRERAPLPTTTDPLSTNYDLLIFDESAHVPAKTFMNVIQNLQFTASLSLTATPERKDGLEKCIYYLLGPPIFRQVHTPNPNVRVRILEFGGTLMTPKSSSSSTSYSSSSTMTSYNRSIDLIVQNAQRNQLIYDELVNRFGGAQKMAKKKKVVEVKQESKNGGGFSSSSSSSNNVKSLNKCLVLSLRVKHLQHFYDRLNTDYVSIYTGSIKKKAAVEEIIILSTFSFTQEGFDFSGNMIFFLLPTGNIRQSAGRITRGRAILPGADPPTIIDINDRNIALLSKKFRQRQKYYKYMQFSVLPTNGYGRQKHNIKRNIHSFIHTSKTKTERSKDDSNLQKMKPSLMSSKKRRKQADLSEFGFIM